MPKCKESGQFVNNGSVSLVTTLFFLASNAICQAQTPQADGNMVCDRAGFRIVLDVGHTELTPGAISARGVPEFQFNRKLAEVVYGRLRDAEFSKARIEIRIREDLFDRARALDAAGAHLILSIHHDSVQSKFLKTWTHNGKLNQHAEEGRFSGYSIFVSRENPRFQDSKKFAVMLGEQLTERKKIFTTYHNEPIPGENRPVVDPDVGVFAYDRLVVLRSVRAPAVLFEAAVIAHLVDEERASSEEYQSDLADSITQATIRFCKELGIVKPGILNILETKPETQIPTETEIKPKAEAVEIPEVKPEAESKQADAAEVTENKQNADTAEVMETPPKPEKDPAVTRSDQDRLGFWSRVATWVTRLFGLRAVQ